MPIVKRDAIWPTPEEDAAIRAGIEADPENYEADAEWFAGARPAVEVHSELVEQWRRTHGKQKATHEESVLRQFIDAFPELYVEKKKDHTIVFGQGARIYFRKTRDGGNTARIISTAVGNFPHGSELESFLQQHGVPIDPSRSHPDFCIGPEHADRVIAILRGTSARRPRRSPPTKFAATPG